MDKRYQVFVSSTYADLKDERSAVMQTLVEMDCIPAGMELFPAADEEQFEFIKRVIDDCDYYILIVGGRYGSLTSEGISYTEKEFDYAVENGIHVLVFLHEDPGKISAEHSDLDQALRDKLAAFREKAQSGRLVKFWREARDLPGLVSLSLNKAMKTYPATGWVKANAVASSEVLGEINTVRKENEELRSRLRTDQSNSGALGISDIALLDETHQFRVRWSVPDGNGKYTDWQEATLEDSWKQIYVGIAPALIGGLDDSGAQNVMNSNYKGHPKLPGECAVQVLSEDFMAIRLQFMALGFIEVVSYESEFGTRLRWKLSESGRRTMLQICSIKTTRSVGGE